MTDKTNDWIEISDYDIDSSEYKLLIKRYLHDGFMRHQTIEKILRL